MRVLDNDLFVHCVQSFKRADQIPEAVKQTTSRILDLRKNHFRKRQVSAGTNSMDASAPDSLAGHVSVMHQLKDSYDAATDVEKVHEVDLLHEEISEVCELNESRIREVIKGKNKDPILEFLPVDNIPPPPPPNTHSGSAQFVTELFL